MALCNAPTMRAQAASSVCANDDKKSESMGLAFLLVTF
jgi:hypothetical protein